MTGLTTSRLPCGTSYDTLAEHVLDGVSPAARAHQDACPHCRAALAELRALWRPVQELTEEDVRAPATLVPTVMARVRELARHTWYAVVPTDRGQTRFAARIVGVVARLAAQEVPEVALALGGGRTAGSVEELSGARAEAATEVGVAGARVVVDVDVAVELGAHIPSVAERLRLHVARTIAEQLELTAVEVNVSVVDVWTAVERD